MTRNAASPATMAVRVLYIAILISAATVCVADGTSSNQPSPSLVLSGVPTSIIDYDGQPQPTLDPDDPNDPLLALMPDFIWSMPVQVLLGGICLALAVVLGFHLAFTGRYHYPLSKVNFVMQTFSCLCLVINVGCDVGVLLATMSKRASKYPYMFPYINVEIPPPTGEWSAARIACYTILQATLTLAAHTTHIQFLTLLYPSNLERRLILWMLGPLALCAAALLFSDLAPAGDEKAHDLGDAFRNICNSTLSLLYLCALLIWGLLVNRRRAWRTDGGTAIFGMGASGLAFITALLSFLGIKWDRLWWLPQIGWTFTVWQSWLGFWWWVGAGMGIGEVEDREMRSAKRAARKAQLRSAAQDVLGDDDLPRKEGPRPSDLTPSASGGPGRSLSRATSHLSGHTHRTSVSHRSHRTTSRASASALSLPHSTRASLRASRPSAAGAGADQDHAPPAAHEVTSQGGDDEMSQVDGPRASLSQRRVSLPGSLPPSDVAWREDSVSDLPLPATSSTATATATFVDAARQARSALLRPTFITERFRRLRVAHLAATRSAATQQTALRDQVLQKRQKRQQQRAPTPESVEEEDEEEQEGEQQMSAAADSAPDMDPNPSHSHHSHPQSRSRSRSHGRDPSSGRHRGHRPHHHHHHHHRRHHRSRPRRREREEDYTLPPTTPPPVRPARSRAPTDSAGDGTAGTESAANEEWISAQLDLLAQDEERRAEWATRRLRAERLAHEMQRARHAHTASEAQDQSGNGHGNVNGTDNGNVTEAPGPALPPPSERPSAAPHPPPHSQEEPPSTTASSSSSSVPVRAEGHNVPPGSSLLPAPLEEEEEAASVPAAASDSEPGVGPGVAPAPAPAPGAAAASRAGGGWAWRGGLRQARLRDRTTYPDPGDA